MNPISIGKALIGSKRINTSRWLNALTLIISLLLLMGSYDIGYSQEIPILVIENQMSFIGSEITVNLVLLKAPYGFQQADLFINVSDPHIVKLEQLSVNETDPDQMFDVISITEHHSRIRLVDLNNNIKPGDENIVIAHLTFRALAEGTATIDVTINVFIDDRSVKVEPEIQRGELNVVSLPERLATDPEPTATNRSRSRVDNFAQLSFTPQDLDEDGLFEDVNGDGTLNNDDAIFFLNKLNDAEMQQNVADFDFNQDGLLDNMDVATLLSIITTPQLNQQALASFHIGSQRVRINETVLIDILLTNVSLDLETFQMKLKLTVPGVARIISVIGVDLDQRYLQVTSQTANEMIIRGADLDNVIQRGSTEVVLARLEIRGLNAGSSDIALIVQSFNNENTKVIDFEIEMGRIEVFSGPASLSSNQNPPNDLDGDGLFEDINGDGLFNVHDALLLAFSDTNPTVLNAVHFFDFNGDGRFSFQDAQALMLMLS